MFELSLFVDLKNRAIDLVREFRMISKVTNATTLTDAEKTLTEILIELGDAKEPIKAAALNESGSEQKRIAALGVELENQKKKLQEKLTSAQAQLNDLSDAEREYLGLPKRSTKKKTDSVESTQLEATTSLQSDNSER